MARLELIGREHEVAEVSARLSAHRLVTVTGTGGIGKSTLASVVATAVAPRFPLGRRTVDLAPVEDPEAVAGALAAQLGFASFASLLDSPAEQAALLLVDGCEHVLDATADVVAELLDACPAATVLATSRSPIGLPEESVVVLGPLPLAPPGLASPDTPAIRLFLERARHAGATLDGHDVDDVAALCRALDGVPLALEIAAARTRSLTPRQVLDGLGDLDTLTRVRFRGRDRHRSLRSVISSSHGALEEGDRRFFDRLAVLAGTFDLDTAHAVAADGRSANDTARCLDRLVDASLLVAEPVAGRMRYRQLDTLRTFAREQLEASGAWDTTWQRFLDHVTAWSVELVTSSVDRWDAGLLAGLLTRTESHLAALRWCARHDIEPTRCLVLLATLWGVVHQGRAEEVGALADEVLQRWPDPALPGWPDAAATAGTCRYLTGLPAEAIALAEAALPHATSAYAPCTLRRLIAQARAACGDLEGAITALDEAAALARRQVPSLAMELTAFRAELAANRGEVDQGLREVHVVIDDASASGSTVNEVWARAVEASLLLRREPTTGSAAAAAALDRARAAGYPACAWVNLHTMAEAALTTGDGPTAAALLLELLEDLITGGAENEARNALRSTAVLLERSGRPSWRDLAATAAAMPVVSIFAVPGYERLALPPWSGGRVLDRREVVRRARTELQALLERGSTPAPPVPATEARPGVAAAVGAPERRWVRRGDHWDVTWNGRQLALRHSKGMADLARLLAAGGQEVHCLDLAGAGVDEPSTGEVLDGEARRRYEQRIRDLQADLEEAEDANDRGRAARAQHELDTLLDHLAAGLGLLGTGRRGTSSAERARSAVTQRVRSTIRRIGRDHPELGRHLERSVTTGTWCSYRPEQPVSWDLG